MDSFINLFTYHKGDFNTPEDYERLEQYLDTVENDWQAKSNRLFYLAVPPTLYESIFEQLSLSKIALSDENTWSRIIVEKPFGNDLQTAENLDKSLGKLFSEDQIYRIDHYLGKEVLQNILTFRFFNNILEHSWNRDLIDQIEVRLLETNDVGNRGDSYDPVGALRDVGQNHLLQMLALVVMDAPEDFTAKSVREKRAAVLKALVIPHKEIIQTSYIRKQYKGYRDTEGVSPETQTETYFKIESTIDNERWHGVPIILEGGKKMPEQKKEIVVTFKHQLPCLCPPTQEHYTNKVIFTLEPDEQIKIIFWAKKPGHTMRVQQRTFDFSYRQHDNPDEEYVAEYEKLFLDCISGDQTLFVSTDEVRAMWNFIDPIIRTWLSDPTPIDHY